MAENPLKKVKEETGLLEKIMLAVPGFSGYKQKEMRREADRLVRDSLYRRMKRSKSDLRGAHKKLVERGDTSFSKRMDSLIAKFDKVSWEINHASYGYSGFFDAVKIQEDDLDSMLAFDLRLVELVKDLGSRTRKFKKIVTDNAGGSIDEWLDSLESTIEVIDDAFNERSEAIKGVRLG
jgi:hypothetical protein